MIVFPFLGICAQRPSATSAAYAAITMPKPSMRFLTPTRRAQCQSPCGVDDTTGTPIAFSSGTMTSSVRYPPHDSTSASA